MLHTMADTLVLRRALRRSGGGVRCGGCTACRLLVGTACAALRRTYARAVIQIELGTRVISNGQLGCQPVLIFCCRSQTMRRHITRAEERFSIVNIRHDRFDAHNAKTAHGCAIAAARRRLAVAAAAAGRGLARPGFAARRRRAATAAATGSGHAFSFTAGRLARFAAAGRLASPAAGRSLATSAVSALATTAASRPASGSATGRGLASPATTAFAASSFTTSGRPTGCAASCATRRGLAAGVVVIGELTFLCLGGCHFLVTERTSRAQAARVKDAHSLGNTRLTYGLPALNSAFSASIVVGATKGFLIGRGALSVGTRCVELLRTIFL